MENEEIIMRVAAMERDFCHLVENVKEAKSSIEEHGKSIRALQDARLTHEAEVQKIATAVISGYQKTKSARVQQWAPYFTATLGFAAAMIAILAR